MIKTSSNVLEKIYKVKNQNLVELDLSGEDLNSIPPEVFELTELKKLNISSNNLTGLPQDLVKLENLEELNATRNKFEKIPEVIYYLRNLNSLFLNDNYIRSIEIDIQKLNKLSGFYIAGNLIKSLPSQIGQLHHLKILHLYDNRLKSIPPELSHLKELEELFLNNNPLRELPESIGTLTNLRYLNVIKNELKILPISIGRLEYIEKIEIEGNDIESPPLEILEKGARAIKNYLNEKSEEGADYFFEAKILVIGEGGAGKTSLCEKIMDSTYILKSEVESETTKGIDIHKYIFDHFRNKKFTANIWDFGGQEIYRSTHQFFLTKRSLYLLVTDPRRDNLDLKYWLHIQELLAGDSPLIIISNEKNERVKEIDEKEIRGRFFNVKEFLQTNLKTNRGLDNILRNVNLQLQNLPHIGNELPRSWIRVRKIIEKLDLDFISLEKFLSICKNEGVEEKEGALLLSGYLHDLGVILHFQDDLLLKRMVILNKDWGTEAVYKLLDHSIIKTNSGEFTNDDLPIIWDESHYQGRYAELINLLRKFKMCYEIRDTGKYIVPEKLSHIKPGYSLKGKILQLKYTYRFMPKGIVTRFIVNMHESIKDDLVWKKGVVLQRENASAEVIENYDGNEISIRVCQEDNGVGADGLRSIIMHEIDKINNKFNNLKVNKLIPCTCDTCKYSSDPEFYREEKLKEFYKNGKYSKDCDRSPYAKVNLKGLFTISGIANFPKRNKDKVQKELKTLVELNKLKEVHKELRIIFNEDTEKENQVILLSRNLKDAVSQKRKDIDGGEYNITLNRVANSTIELINEIDEF